MSTASIRRRRLAVTLLGAIATSALITATPALAQAPASGPDAAAAAQGAVTTAPSSATQAPSSLATPQASQSSPTSATAPSTQPTAVQEVVVTGSLFRRTNTETPSPVTLLTADQIAKQGIVSISDAVRSISADNSGTLPTAFPGAFAGGASGVSLRGLTVADTLVLIDGLRTADYPIADDGVRSFQDLNTIPLVNIDRVEVLKDGASSLYGADAIGGVVNIITKQTYKGFEADAAYGDSQHGGGQETRASFIAGKGDLGLDGWNAYISAEYDHDQQIAVHSRGFPYNTENLSSIGGLDNNSGILINPNYGSTYGAVAPASGPNAGVFQPLRPCGVGSVQSNASGAGVTCEQNLQGDGDDQPSQTRGNVEGRFTKQLDHDNQFFLSFSYADNRVLQHLVPAQVQSLVPTNTSQITLPAVLSNGTLNPNNPFAALGEAASISYAFGDIPAERIDDNTVIRGVAGVKGDLFGFNYEADVTIAHSDLGTTETGEISYDGLINAIANGGYSFINPGSNTAAEREAISPVFHKVSTFDLDSFDFHASRNVFTLPGGPLAVAIGGQVRYEATRDPTINPLEPDGNLEYIGNGEAFAFGQRTVGAAYFEVDGPVLKQLDVNVSGRYDHYSDFGGTFNPKVGLKFTPFRQLAFRATYSTGFRAPSVAQNGSAASEGFTVETAASLPASFVAAHSPGGVPDAYVQSYTIGFLSTGNSAIKPETSETYTAGFVFEPNRLFNVSVDYYHIRQDGIIAQESPSAALNAYFSGTAIPVGNAVQADAADPQAPGALARPVLVSAPYVNANALTTDGLDIDLRANLRLPYDVRFTSELNATDIFGYEFTADGDTVNYVGTEAPYILSSGAGTPKYKANWSNTFSYGPATITGTVYFTSGFKQTGVDETGTSDIVSGCLYPGLPSNCRVQDFWDFDLTGSYAVTRQIELYANILNLFDQSPPLNPANYAGTNYNPTYAQAGIIGRYFRVGLHYKF